MEDLSKSKQLLIHHEDAKERLGRSASWWIF